MQRVHVVLMAGGEDATAVARFADGLQKLGDCVPFSAGAWLIAGDLQGAQIVDRMKFVLGTDARFLVTRMETPWMSDEEDGELGAFFARAGWARQYTWG